jgi:hypothetical protein
VCPAAEDVLPQLARSVGAGSVYCYGEVTAEEVKMESAVARALDKAGAALKVRQRCILRLSLSSSAAAAAAKWRGGEAVLLVPVPRSPVSSAVWLDVCPQCCNCALQCLWHPYYRRWEQQNGT